MLNKFIMILCFAGIISYSPAQDTTQGTQNQERNSTRTQTEEGNNTQTQEFNAFNSVCPVDGQEIDPGIETIRHNGKDYGFDSPSCALVFSEDPEIYAGQLSDDGADFTRRELEPEERDQLGTETNGTGTGQRDQMGTEDQNQGQDQIGTQDQNQTGNQDQNQTQEDQMGTTGQDTTQQKDQMGTEDQIQSQGQDQIGTETQPADTTDQFGTEPIDTTDQFGTEPTDTTDQFGTEEEENGTQDQIE